MVEVEVEEVFSRRSRSRRSKRTLENVAVEVGVQVQVVGDPVHFGIAWVSLRHRYGIAKIDPFFFAETGGCIVICL